MVESLILCQARDGSTSLRDVVQGFFALNDEAAGLGRLSPNNTALPAGTALRDFGYVTDTFRLWPAILRHLCRGDSASLYSILAGWRHKVEVSHGLGFVLPAVRAVFGRDLRLVRVVRDRRDHVRSLVNQSHIDPQHWIGYRDAGITGAPASDRVVRPTAVDFGEASEGAWDRMSTWDRFEWFVDKQTALTERNIRLFANVFTLRTPDISDPDAIAELGRFIDAAWTRAPMPVHIHKMGASDVVTMSKGERHHLEQVWQQFDVDMAVRDPAYALAFALADIRQRLQHDPERMQEILHTAVNASGIGRPWPDGGGADA